MEAASGTSPVRSGGGRHALPAVDQESDTRAQQDRDYHQEQHDHGASLSSRPGFL